MEIPSYTQVYESGAVPRVHGNGFIQVDLNNEGTRRLHVWHENLPRQKVATPIHDHVFDMQSTVILGTLIHEEFTWRRHPDGDFLFYQARREEGTQNTTLQPALPLSSGTVPVFIKRTQRLVMLPGSTYFFPSGRLHLSDHVGLTATIMEKINSPSGYGSPRVLVPVGQEPDNEFHRDAHDVDMLWRYVAAALSIAKAQMLLTDEAEEIWWV
jgi:hypothetical protein